MNRLVCHWVSLFITWPHLHAGLYLERAAKPACSSGGVIAGKFLRQTREGITVG